MTINDVIILPVNQQIIDKTMKNVVKKLNHTNISLMYNRTPVELLDNLYMGDLAKNALYDYLINRVSVPVVDYDEVRKDNFTEPDPGWDMLVGRSRLKVEIKSSTPPGNEEWIDIINKRDIKITASPDKGRTWIRPEDLESEIHVQIYFYARPYKRGYNSLDALQMYLNQDYHRVQDLIQADKYNKPLFFGFQTKSNIIKHVNAQPAREKTWTFSWTERIYWSCPISQAYNLDSLVKYINSDAKDTSLVSAPNVVVTRKPTPAPANIVTQNTNSGYCIRCKAEIPYMYGMKRPRFYCKDCWKAWYKAGSDTNKIEQYCHRCGKTFKSSFNNPVCSNCK